MSKGTSGWVTVLLRLPLFYNPDASGHREPVEDAKFLVTAEEIARRPSRCSTGVLVGRGDCRSRCASVLS